MTPLAGKTNWCNLNRNKTKIPLSKLLFLCMRVLSSQNNTESIRNTRKQSGWHLYCVMWRCYTILLMIWRQHGHMHWKLVLENSTLVTDGTNKTSLKIFKPNRRLPNFPLILFLTLKDCRWTLTICLGYSWDRGTWYQYFQSILCSESKC